jgi:hypothetical protein
MTELKAQQLGEGIAELELQLSDKPSLGDAGLQLRQSVDLANSQGAEFARAVFAAERARLQGSYPIVEQLEGGKLVVLSPAEREAAKQMFDETLQGNAQFKALADRDPEIKELLRKSILELVTGEKFLTELESSRLAAAQTFPSQPKLRALLEQHLNAINGDGPALDVEDRTILDIALSVQRNGLVAYQVEIDRAENFLATPRNERQPGLGAWIERAKSFPR